MSDNKQRRLQRSKCKNVLYLLMFDSPDESGATCWNCNCHIQLMMIRKANRITWAQNTEIEETWYTHSHLLPNLFPPPLVALVMTPIPMLFLNAAIIVRRFLFPLIFFLSCFWSTFVFTNFYYFSDIFDTNSNGFFLAKVIILLRLWSAFPRKMVWEILSRISRQKINLPSIHLETWSPIHGDKYRVEKCKSCYACATLLIPRCWKLS